MREGQTIVFSGEADQAPGVQAGDVVIVVEEKAHPTFKRKGDDLFAEVHIPLLTSLAGGQFTIPHLDERVLLVTVHPGEVIKPGQLKVMRGQGMPSYRHHEPGDLILTMHVDFPESLPAEMAPQLEGILPPRDPLPSFEKNILIDDHVSLDDADDSSKHRAAHADDAMDEDSDGPAGGPGVQCANQ